MDLSRIVSVESSGGSPTRPTLFLPPKLPKAGPPGNGNGSGLDFFEVKTTYSDSFPSFDFWIPDGEADWEVYNDQDELIYSEQDTGFPNLSIVGDTPGTKTIRVYPHDWEAVTGDMWANYLDLVGEIHPGWGNLVNLDSLDFIGNSFEGPFPSFFYNMTNLRSLWISWEHQLTGPITSDIQNLQLLEDFDLGGNPISGDLGVFANMPNLKDLHLDNMQYEGPIPSVFSTLTGLERLWVHTNDNLTGYQPGAFTTQANMFSLRLQACSLTTQDVDNILADLVTSLSLPGRAVMSFQTGAFGGVTLQNNAPPSSAGMDDRDTLIGAGWSVTVDT